MNDLKNIILVSDTWRPQVNGVVTTLRNTIKNLEDLGHSTVLIEPSAYRSLSCPFYPGIRLVYSFGRVYSFLEHLFRRGFDHIHIVTEGPLGYAVSRFCQENEIKYTTSYLTRWNKFAPRWLSPLVKRYIAQIHKGASSIFVASPEVGTDELPHVPKIVWSKGVDTSVFYPRPKRFPNAHFLLYVGRLSKEKSIEDFLNIKTNAYKVVVGDGPELKRLITAYPQAIFTGPKFGDELAQLYSDADCLVFPSKSDTFGLVMIEALACGTPVAAYPILGPNQIVTQSEHGALNDNLCTAIKEATMNDTEMSRQRRVSYVAQNYSWVQSARNFAENLVNASISDNFHQ